MTNFGYGPYPGQNHFGGGGTYVQTTTTNSTAGDFVDFSTWTWRSYDCYNEAMAWLAKTIEKQSIPQESSLDQWIHDHREAKE